MRWSALPLLALYLLVVVLVVPIYLLTLPVAWLHEKAGQILEG